MFSRRRGPQNNAAASPSPLQVDTTVAGSTDAGSNPTPPQTRSSFFPGTSSPVISNGQFIGHQNIHFVFNNSPPFDRTGSSSETRPPAENNRGSSFNLSVQRISSSRPSRISRAWLRFLGRAPQNQILHRNNSPVERDVFEIYKRHLLPKGYGHPLWIPQSNMRLPVPYRRIGVSIGDVGIITREGAFDFLFNICYSRDHPINSLVQLPPDFEPLTPSINLDSNILEYREFSWGTHLASDNIRANQAHPNGTQFTTSSPQGAILTMPRGAYIQRLANIDHFHEYIAANAASWYGFVNGQLRRAAKNGDIRIVLGCHKSTTWGMATVLNTSQYAQTQTLRFGAFPPNNHSNHLSYFWEASGPVLVKVGPEPGDNDGLSENQAQELRNQCLFVRTDAVTLGENSWSRLHPTDVTSSVGGINNPLNHDVILQRVPTAVQSTIPRNVEHRGRQSSVALLSDAPSLDTIDHTKAINTLLLQEHPEMQVAIMEDNEWCSVLGGDDPTQLTSADLFLRICNRNDVRKTSTGLVHFVLKDRNPEKPPITYTELEVAGFLESIKRDQATLKVKLLTHLPDFKKLGRIIRSGYFSKSIHNEAIPIDDFPPFLMERPEDLFVFDKLLESFRSDDPALAPLHLDDKFTKSEAYKQLDSLSFPQAQRRRFLKALGDRAWKQYLQFGRLDDLDETIWLYGKAISLTAIFSIQSLVPLFGLCSALFRRFFLKRSLHDLVQLARYIRRQESIDFKELINLLPSVPAAFSAAADENDTSASQTQPLPFLKVQPMDSQQPSPPSRVINTRFPSASVDLSAQLKEDYIPLPRGSTSTEELVLEKSGEALQREDKFLDMLNLIQHWIENPNSHTPILWFYGPSAMTMVSNLIERLPRLDTGSHVGSIFTFSDKAAWNGEARQLFPAIAVELAYSIPGLLEQYRKIMSGKGSQEVMSASLDVQFWTLIVDPIRNLPSKHTRTVIINAIDNCGYETTRTILTLITNALVVFALPLRFLIASNRDPRLQDLFNRPSLSSISRQFFVSVEPSNTSSNGTKDPAAVLRHGFKAICEQHPTLMHPGGNKWPSEDVFDLLVEKSRKNPIYADTVISFLASVGGGEPIAQLQRVMEPILPFQPSQEITVGFTDLDNLFTYILSTYHNRRNTLVHALGILLVLHDCAQPQTILQDMFGMRTETYNSVLQVLRSLMHFPKVENEHDIHPWRAVKKNVPKKDQRVKSPFLVLALLSLSTMAMPTAFTIPSAFRDRVHDSFYDFLVNPERSGPFHVDIAKYHGHLTMEGFTCVVNYMWRPSRLNLRLGRNQSVSSETWDYLSIHLPDHYSQCPDKVREGIIERLQDALIAVSNGTKDTTESDAVVWTDEFQNNVAVLLDLIINNWDSFGEWSHFTSKPTGKYVDFSRVMAVIREDLFPRRSTPRLRRLSGKFTRASAGDSQQHHQYQQEELV